MKKAIAAITQITTTVNQDALARDTVGIFTQMPDSSASAPVSDLAAEGALAYLTEMSADLRGAAFLADDGTVLAAVGDSEAWGDPVRALLAAADGAGDEPVEQIHVTTEGGEVFVLRQDGLVAVAVTDRFVLSSLMAFDMRAALRRLAASATPAAGGAV